MTENLEYQYSPSRWSKRFNAEEVIAYHLKFTQKESESTRRDIPHETFRYGNNEKQMVDIFGTNLPQDAPLLVYIHGGYWQEGDRSISAYPVKPLVQNGVKVAIAGYDLAPKVSVKTIMEEIWELGEFISEYGKKNGTKKIFYAGHSAGGHLSACLLKSPKKITLTGLILISGVFDLTPLVGTYINNPLKLSREEAYELSINRSDLNKEKLKVLVTVGGNESDEFIRQSREIYEELKKADQDAEFLLVEDVDHFDIVENLSDEGFILTKRIINLIKD